MMKIVRRNGVLVEVKSLTVGEVFEDEHGHIYQKVNQVTYGSGEDKIQLNAVALLNGQLTWFGDHERVCRCSAELIIS